MRRVGGALAGLILGEARRTDMLISNVFHSGSFPESQIHFALWRRAGASEFTLEASKLKAK